MIENSAEQLLREIRHSDTCKDCEPEGSIPLLNFSSKSRILIVGQAPGIKAITSQIPWDDASGKRLRSWLGVSPEAFYDASNFAIVPLDFCYPGRGSSGDLPPRSSCAERWMNRVLAEMPHIKLTILVGQYAQKYFLKRFRKKTLTETVQAWQEYYPRYMVLPHPSPRNNIWLAKHPWFEERILPELKAIVNRVL